ncbi:MAG: tRNA pseudouridine(38-40) synthase TruA [Bacteroidales bacterium]|jgi:tRNA pseudouridine38-40 synthase|nr:tRNA pseudouridine(38-40) synthase TruA [Bacteroidales bacterium]
MRYKIELSYNGSEYFGWQKQPNNKTIQQTIEDAFLLIFKDKVEIIGCGRTDTGVHAKQYFAHFDSKNIFSLVETEKLNKYLPDSINIISINKTSDNFHARFSAISRTYEYYISTSKNPFYNNLSWYIFQKLNVDLMQEAVNQLYNYSDFTSFSKLHTDVKTNNCKIINANFTIKEDFIILRITADRFLRNMVRAIVGTLIEVGKEKLSVKDFCKIIESKNRCAAGQSVPAKGLFLVSVEY